MSIFADQPARLTLQHGGPEPQQAPKDRSGSPTEAFRESQEQLRRDAASGQLWRAEAKRLDRLVKGMLEANKLRDDVIRHWWSRLGQALRILPKP